MISIKVDSSKVERQFRKISKSMSTLMVEAHSEFVKNTPKRTGNARNKTRKLANQIKADYNYASALDKGKSKQAPQGMTKPTLEFIERKIDRIIKENR